MPLTPDFRKDLVDLKKVVLQDRNFPAAKTLIESLLVTQSSKYTEEEVAIVRHALLHLDSIIAGLTTVEEEQVQFGKLGRILNEDTEKVV